MQRHRLRTIAFLAVGIFSSRGLAQSAISDALTLRIDSVFSRYNASTPGCAVGVFQNGKIAMSKGLRPGEHRVRRADHAADAVHHGLGVEAVHRGRDRAPRRAGTHLARPTTSASTCPSCTTTASASRSTISSITRAAFAISGRSSMPRACGPTTATRSTTCSRSRRDRSHLNFDPGAEYNYSNTGYVLLGIVVKRVTGKTLRQFAAEQIFTPLGMSSSHFHDDHNEPVRGRASAYSPLPGGALDDQRVEQRYRRAGRRDDDDRGSPEVG